MLSKVLLGGGAGLLMAGYVKADLIEIGAGVLRDRSDDAVPVLQGGWVSNQYPQLGGIQFQAGALVAEQDTFYLHGGIIRTWELPGRWAWGAGISAGGYHTSADKLDLGHDVEFMTRLYLDYEVSIEHTLRAEIGHLSNASLGEHNPGLEYVQFKWLFRY